MARKRSSFFEDLVEIAAKLPWAAGVAFALISYFGFHYVSKLPLTPVIATDMKAFGQNIGGSTFRALAITLSSFLQYIVAVAFLLGSGISLYRRRRQAKLHHLVASVPNRNSLEQMSWQEFEGLTAEVFRRKGFHVIERGGNGPDGGVDLELHVGKDKYLVQCKQWKVLKVGVAIVRELFGVMVAEGAVGGFVVASGQFTDEAKRFAAGRSIELVSTDTLLAMVKETGGPPSQSIVEPAEAPRCPRCQQAMVRRTAKRGEGTGSGFWGCSQYPKCRGVRSSEESN